MPSIDLSWNPEATELDTLQQALVTGRGWFLSETLYRREKHAEEAGQLFGTLQPLVVESGSGYRIAIPAGPRPLSVRRFLDRICAVHKSHNFELVVADDASDTDE